MGVLRFDAADWISFATSAALGNTADGAWSCAVLFKRGADDAVSHGLAYLVDDFSDTQAGISIDGGDNIVSDLTAAVGNLSGTLTVTGTTETYIGFASKAAGTTNIIYRRYVRSTTTWSNQTTSGTRADGVAAGALEIGTWEGGADLANAWIGLVGFWEGAMSQANAEALDNNWASSDWLNNAHGTPTALIEMNVAAASLVDVTGNATSPSITGSPTLDAGETLSSWTFDAGGAPPTSFVRPSYTSFPKQKIRESVNGGRR